MPYLTRVKTGYLNLLVFVSYFFSLSLLVKTFFVPWKRMSWKKTWRGLDLSGSFLLFASNIVSIFIGMFLRSFMLLLGIYAFFSAVIFGIPLVLLLTLITPHSLLFNRALLLRQRSLAWDWHYGFTPTLDRYAHELYYEQLDIPMLGRQNELSVLLRTFTSKDGRNILLIADSGMGRHALLSAASRVMIDKRFMVFDYHSFFKDAENPTAQSGAFEDLLREADTAGNIVMVIFSMENMLPFTAVLQEFLQSSTMHIVGVSTTNVYHKQLLKNEDFMKHFTTLELSHLNHGDLISIVRNYAKLLMAFAICSIASV